MLRPERAIPALQMTGALVLDRVDRRCRARGCGGRSVMASVVRGGDLQVAGDAGDL
jgi:hypothetical protein